MNQQVRILTTLLVAGALAFGIVLWDRGGACQPAVLLPVILALALVAAGVVRSRRQSSPRPPSPLPAPVRLLVILVAVGLPVAIALFQLGGGETSGGAGRDAPAYMPWAVLALIIGLLVVLILVRARGGGRRPR